MQIVTTEHLPGHNITVVGFVHETAVISADTFGDMFASVKNFLGGKVGNYEKLAAKARMRVLEQCAEQARRFGADAIVGAKVDVDFATYAKGGFCFATCTGTAVTSTPTQ